MEIDTEKLNKLPVKKVEDVKDLIDEKVKHADNVKTAIDILTTKSALEQEGTVETLVEEKTQELKNDAQSKRVQSETVRINSETDKIKAEKEKELEELDKVIKLKEKEVEQLKRESDIAQAFYDANKDILSYVGVKQKKSLGTMRTLMIPAVIIFIVIQILILPITFTGKTLEALVAVVGGICGEIKNNAIKIIVTILVLLLIGAIVFLTYFYGIKLFK